jgi:phosphoenolpyruvate synthase/pyruvate phosphate dikinase
MQLQQKLASIKDNSGDGVGFAVRSSALSEDSAESSFAGEFETVLNVRAAIVARELGIPAVVGCGDATACLKTGDRVRVNGSRGTVERLPTSSARI